MKGIFKRSKSYSNETSNTIMVDRDFEMVVLIEKCFLSILLRIICYQFVI